MATLRDVGDAAKGDKRGRRGGCKGIITSNKNIEINVGFV
jgi:hypothetical protein